MKKDDIIKVLNAHEYYDNGISKKKFGAPFQIFRRTNDYVWIGEKLLYTNRRPKPIEYLKCYKDIVIEFLELDQKEIASLSPTQIWSYLKDKQDFSIESTAKDLRLSTHVTHRLIACQLLDNKEEFVRVLQSIK